MSLKPFVFWGQDKDYVYLSVKVPDCQSEEVNIGSEQVSFSGESASRESAPTQYAFTIDLYLPIVTADSSWRALQREVTFRLRKEYKDPWPRLTYGKEKQPWIRIDFDRFQDSEESAEEEAVTRSGKDSAAEGIDREWEEAERFWRYFKNPLTIYLVLFNLFQFAGFTFVFGALFYKVAKHGPEGKFQVFDLVRDRLITVQIASVLEIFHALLRWVPSGVLTTGMQVFGRNLVLFFILLPHPELHNLEVTFWLFVAWSIIELVRYPYYLLGVLQSEHWMVTYLRYTLWIPLYPLGFVCEGLLILKAFPEIDREEKFSIALPNAANFAFHFPTFLHIYLVLMMIGFYSLMAHMYHRRKKKIGPNPRSQAKGMWRLVPGVHSLIQHRKKA